MIMLRKTIAIFYLNPLISPIPMLNLLTGWIIKKNSIFTGTAIFITGEVWD
jgi:hypothetical protein